jgi:hypothetical protein
VFVQLLLHKGRIDVRRIFNGYFNRRKTPFFERFEEFCAVVGEGRSEQKGIDAKSHNGFFDRLVERGKLSKAFAAGKDNTGASDTTAAVAGDAMERAAVRRKLTGRFRRNNS